MASYGMAYTSLTVEGGLLVLSDETTNAVWLTRQAVRGVEVDWETESGRLVVLADVGRYAVEYTDGDLGERCGAELGELGNWLGKGE